MNKPVKFAAPRVSRWRKWRARTQQLVSKLRPSGTTRRPSGNNGPDFGSVLAVVAFVVVGTLLSHVAAPPPSKAGEPRIHRSAEHVFVSEFADETEAEDASSLCVGSVEPMVRTYACTPSEYAAWRWSAQNVLRTAMGAKPCWWHADVADLAAISGITETYAAKAISARDAESTPRLVQELGEDIGAHRARLLRDAVTMNCAMTPRGAEASTAR